ncbi:MAG: septum formation initiator family protein [Candidatus Peribacteraceae bacterium]
MPYRDLEPVSKQLTIVVGLTVVGAMAFGLALSYYRNILFEQTLKNINLQNAALHAEIDQGYRDLEYYRSAQYKDKYAKENLGLVNPGENVLIIKQTTQAMASELQQEDLRDDQRRAAYLELLRQMPVYDHWKLYLFERDKLQQLKKGL